MVSLWSCRQRAGEGERRRLLPRDGVPASGVLLTPANRLHLSKTTSAELLLSNEAESTPYLGVLTASADLKYIPNELPNEEIWSRGAPPQISPVHRVSAQTRFTIGM